MTFNRQLSSISRRLTLIIVGLSVFSVLLLSLFLWQSNTIRFSDDVSSGELHSIVEDSPAVVEYLEQEKDFEAHFVSIASLVKNDSQKSLGQTLLITTVPVIIVAAVIGFLVSRIVMRPVKESYESQERFLQDAAHELRNPLAAMSLALENEKTNGNNEFYKVVNRQTKRLVRINEELLFLERRSPDKAVQTSNISNLLEDVLEDLRQPIVFKKLQVKTKIQPDIEMKINGEDFIKLSKNIIENAIKYTKPGKRIEISLVKDKKISFTVKDQGIGIPEKDLNNVGERFFRAKNTGDIDGTGLGMAIVKKIVNVYGGEFMIKSKVNRGTTVNIKF